MVNGAGLDCLGRKIRLMESMGLVGTTIFATTRTDGGASSVMHISFTSCVYGFGIQSC